ncbi:hypothetical protein H310_00792 [Aphanomyces invadans]|uniref:Uncharacterized protein n=1 Tax=Aphanomyces invadans TaxID=157072 RepID=A0A024UX35_9STRA|nr:hypothetical protein H310_00792 [Aphanomyces invadans]ETW10502.1 hypothetical protein H310_00792 [Aphanomyces invadans]|eukprot:XP_008861913.1 hypothetical protein H310_00792 [Aphanomyces invadans]
MATPTWANGSVVAVTHVTTGTSFRALVEKDKAGPIVTFCNLDAPYEKLKVSQNDGETSWGAGGGKFAAFVATPLDTAGTTDHVFTLQLCANQKKTNASDGSEGWYLGVVPSASTCRGIHLTPGYVLIGNAAAHSFAVAEITSRAHMQLSAATACSLPPLTPGQIDSFCRDGYVILPRAVPVPLVHDALRRINHELGKPGMMIQGGVEGTAKLAGNTSNHPAILDLYNPLHAAVESLIGRGCVDRPQGAQLALRFPEVCAPYQVLGTEWHTDGMRQGKWNPFTLLVGVTLSDSASSTECGNLLVFPRTHHTLHKMLQSPSDKADLLRACTAADKAWGQGQGLPDLGPPLALRLSPGDAVLAHPKTAHRGGPNFSPHIRYQVYFRIKHKDHAALQTQLETNLYADLEGCWPGLD